MSTLQIREALHQYINEADERFIQLVYGMMKADENIEKHVSVRSYEIRIENAVRYKQTRVAYILRFPFGIEN